MVYKFFWCRSVGGGWQWTNEQNQCGWDEIEMTVPSIIIEHYHVELLGVQVQHKFFEGRGSYQQAVWSRWNLHHPEKLVPLPGPESLVMLGGSVLGSVEGRRRKTDTKSIIQPSVEEKRHP